jgi:hypothetical protein
MNTGQILSRSFFNISRFFKNPRHLLSYTTFMRLVKNCLTLFGKSFYALDKIGRVCERVLINRFKFERCR